MVIGRQGKECDQSLVVAVTMRDQSKTIVGNSFSEPTLLGVRKEAAVLGVMQSKSSFWGGGRMWNDTILV